ncbi:MAG: DUF3784 domain-containing protein [Ruminococcaceae bacterium]|nr:DUF3784 domain-containing protein [Oscillospiraceae bacterium]
MNQEAIVVVIIHLPIIILFLVLGIVLWRGKGAWLIAGYNTSSKSEKARYDEKALCRFVARLMFFCAGCTVLFALSPLVGMWLFWLAFILMLVVIIAGVIYANTGNRFKKR